MIQQKFDRSFRLLLRFSVAIAITLFLLNLLFWSLPFPFLLLALLAKLGLWFLLVCAFVWSMIHLFRNRRRRKAYLPLAVNAIALVLLLKFPFLNVWLTANDTLMRSARQEVVSLVQAGKLTSTDASGTLQLPPTYAHTSEGSEIQQEGNSILFFTFRGIDNYGGFVYAPEGPAPQVGEIKFYGKVVQVENFGDGWYWISAT